MYVVLVQVTVRQEMLAEFERVLIHNARESVARDRGCLRFDVSQHVDDPTRWVLYEMYDAPDCARGAQAIAAFSGLRRLRSRRRDREDGVPLRHQARNVSTPHHSLTYEPGELRR